MRRVLLIRHYALLMSHLPCLRAPEEKIDRSIQGVGYVKIIARWMEGEMPWSRNRLGENVKSSHHPAILKSKDTDPVAPFVRSKKMLPGRIERNRVRMSRSLIDGMRTC